MEKHTAEYWISQLGLVEHPGPEDGYFAVPFMDTFSVRNVRQVGRGRVEWKVASLTTCCPGGETGCLYRLLPAEEGGQSEFQDDVLQV